MDDRVENILGFAELPTARRQRLVSRERGRLDAILLSLLVRLQRSGRLAELPSHAVLGATLRSVYRSTSWPTRS